MIDSFILSFLSYIPERSGGFHGVSNVYWVIIIGSMVVSWAVGAMLKSRFKTFSQHGMPMTGAQVAKRMLEENGIYDVKVMSTPGQLTDHYDPRNKTVNLSDNVYGSATVAAAAVAAHECGHAVQHAKAYHWLTLRSFLVPMVSIASNLVQWVLIIGIVLMAVGNSNTVLIVGVVLFGMTTLFAFVTLPVEFDASRRALAWMRQSQVGGYMEQSEAKSALFWAAMTYVVAALSSLAMLMYYVMMLLGNGRRD